MPGKNAWGGQSLWDIDIVVTLGKPVHYWSESVKYLVDGHHCIVHRGPLAEQNGP